MILIYLQLLRINVYVINAFPPQITNMATAQNLPGDRGNIANDGSRPRIISIVSSTSSPELVNTACSQNLIFIYNQLALDLIVILILSFQNLSTACISNRKQLSRSLLFCHWQNEPLLFWYHNLLMTRFEPVYAIVWRFLQARHLELKWCTIFRWFYPFLSHMMGRNPKVS